MFYDYVGVYFSISEPNSTFSAFVRCFREQLEVTQVGRLHRSKHVARIINNPIASPNKVV